MAKKIRITLTFDENIWYLLGLKVQGSRSQFLENLAREYIFVETDLDKLRDEIAQEEVELNAKRKYLKEQVRIQEINDKNIDLINKAMATIKKILSNQKNIIGLNQIHGVANINGLTPGILEKEVKKIKDIIIETTFEPPRN